MKSISDVLQSRVPIKEPKSQRAYIIKMIVDRLKSEREAATFYFKDGEKIFFYVQEGKRIPLKPISDRTIAIRVGHLKTNNDLFYLHSTCKNSTNYSKMFWYLTRSKVLA